MSTSVVLDHQLNYCDFWRLRPSSPSHQLPVGIIDSFTVHLISVFGMSKSKIREKNKNITIYVTESDH